jgi:aspartate-semialdehyde dehydrogenase
MSHSSKRLKTAVLGATGAVGQRFVELLADHPWFEMTRLSASDRSSGKSYQEACGWRLPSPIPRAAAGQIVEDMEPDGSVDLAFSALSADVAPEVEMAWARAGVPVFSNARSYRLEPDVPLLIPEINPDHLELIAKQKAFRQLPDSGFIVTNANCSTTVLAMALAPIERAFGLRRVSVVTLQAISGAGYPGLPSMEILGNVIPFISGEEEKMESETRKILGKLTGGRVAPAELVLSAQVNRVPVFDGHTESVSFETARPARLEEIREALTSFRGEPQEAQLPSAPCHPVLVLDGRDRPQPMLDLYREKAMATLVGRLRPCPVLGFKMSLLGHNTIRGAAGGSILNAELAYARGLFSVLRGPADRPSAFADFRVRQLRRTRRSLGGGGPAA